MENEDKWAKIANQWNKYSRPAIFDPHRIAYKEHHFSAGERNIKTWLDLLPKSNEAFEFGCGSGCNLIYLIHAGKINKGAGIDISTGALNNASVLAKAYDVNNFCEFKYMNYFDFAPNEDDLFGIILSIQFINYITDLRSFFIKCSKISKTGSIILIHDVQHPVSPLIEFAYRIFKRYILRKMDANPTFLHYYKCNEIKMCAKKFGFSVVSEHYDMPHYFLPVMIIHRKLALTEYSSENIRLLVKNIYIAVRTVLEYVSKKLSKEKNSIWYCVILKKL